MRAPRQGQYNYKKREYRIAENVHSEFESSMFFAKRMPSSAALWGFRFFVITLSALPNYLRK